MTDDDKTAMQAAWYEWHAGVSLHVMPAINTSFGRGFEAGMAHARRAAVTSAGVTQDTLENAQKRSEYWKAEHAAANKEIERLKKQASAYRSLTKAQEEQLSLHRYKAEQYRAAVATVDSERAANETLTQEIAGLRGENAVLADILRDADEVIAAIESGDVTTYSLHELGMAISHALEPYKANGDLLI